MKLLTLLCQYCPDRRSNHFEHPPAIHVWRCSKQKTKHENTRKKQQSNQRVDEYKMVLDRNQNTLQYKNQPPRATGQRHVQNRWPRTPSLMFMPRVGLIPDACKLLVFTKPGLTTKNCTPCWLRGNRLYFFFSNTKHQLKHHVLFNTAPEPRTKKNTSCLLERALW